MASMYDQQVVLITGCTQGGIGYALAEEYFARGFHVIATARNTKSLEGLRSSRSGNGKISTLALDVTNEESISEAVRFVANTTGGRLDFLVNNAGRSYAIPALDADPITIRSVFETNVYGVMAMCQAFSPLLVRTSKALRSTSPEAIHPTIVMIGSISAVNPYVFGSIYNASKAALHAYSNTLRLELSPFSVNVLLIVTGGVQSNIAVQRSIDGPTIELKDAGELIKLPANSLYHPIETEYNRRQTHSQEGAMPARLYARDVVNASLSPGKKEIWTGNKGALVMNVVGWLGRWVLDLVMIRMFGLDRLKLIFEGQKKVD